MNATVIGLGKLGSPLLAVIANKIGGAIGVDTDEETLRKLGDYTAPVDENGLQETLDLVRLASGVNRLSTTTELGNAVLDSGIVFVVVPTPSQTDGQFSTEHVRKVAEGIGKALRNTLETQDERYRLFVLVSTVMPGQTQADFLDVIAETSGVPYGEAWGVCYSPEFIAIGSVIHDILNPDFTLIGALDYKAANTLVDFYSRIYDNNPPFRLMNLVSAEIAKLSLNCYVTMKISYANMLAEMCEKIPGAHVDVVTEAIGLDSRIGTKFLKGATAYGGPCFPRDTLALQAFMHHKGPACLIYGVEEINNRQIRRLADIVISNLSEGPVAFIGTSYKPGTSEITESATMRVIAEIEKHYPEKTLSTNIQENAQLVIDESSVVVIMLPLAWAKDLDYTGKTVIDCWRVLDNPECDKYIPIGVGAKQ